MNQIENEEGRESRAGRDGHADPSNPEQDRDRNRNMSSDRRGDAHGHSGQAPSLLRTVLASGFVALVCGVSGAWGYWHFIESARSGNEKSSGKNSHSGEVADVSKKAAGDGKLQQMEEVRKAAVLDLDKAEKAAQRSAEETKAVLAFVKNKLLSAGRPGDVSLAEAFRAGGQGKDVTLRKAVDAAEPQIAEAFADRPLGEASVREMLGSTYLNLGEPARAVTQYERAFALREAIGINDPDTADCRNQLAVAYRLAGRSADASRLFDYNPNSTANASALAARGLMLLFQKKPAEAELKLRECLTIRRKVQPDDFDTFDAMSMLGEALLDQKQFADAEPLLLSGYEGMKQRLDRIPSQDKPRLNKAIERLVKLYEAWGKNDEAMRWRKDLETAEATRKS